MEYKTSFSAQKTETTGKPPRPTWRWRQRPVWGEPEAWLYAAVCFRTVVSSASYVTLSLVIL